MLNRPQTICFFFGVYKEWDLAFRLSRQLKTIFPTEQILCVTDGTHNSEFAVFCEQQKITYFKGERLFRQASGGAWIKRMFDFFLLKSRADCLISLDPDSFINHAFKELPDADVAGNILSLLDQRQFIQGGCVFFKRAACETIIRSELLNDVKYTCNSLFAYRRYYLPYLVPGEQASSEWYIASDQIWSDVIWKLGLKVEEWNEVYSRVRTACPTPEKYAVIHPVKQL